MSERVTAGVVLIGDELLSGRTRDINLQQIAQFLAPLGIPVVECRTVSDEEDRIVEAVNALRQRCTYVFTTGGIGPTHDDITVDAVAEALGFWEGELGRRVVLLEIGAREAIACGWVRFSRSLLPCCGWSLSIRAASAPP